MNRRRDLLRPLLTLTILLLVTYQPGLAADVCPTDPAAYDVVKLNAPLVNGGNVIAHRSSADAQWVVYMADGETSGVVELYSVPAGGGTVTKLNAALVADGNVLDFQISSDNATVVYLADGDLDERADLYTVPILGGAPTRLTATNSDATDEFAIVPDGTQTVYRIQNDLFSVPTTGGMPLQLTVPGFDWPQPGFKISPDSSYVVYIDDQPGQQGLSGLAVDGSSRTGYACCIAWITDFRFSADGSRVVWQLETNTNFYTQSNALTGGSEETYCFQTAGGTQVETLGVTPPPLETMRVLYVCNYPQRLVSEPMDGGTQTDLDDSGIILGITPDGSRVVSRWVDPSIKSPTEGDLRSVGVAGGTPVTLNPPLVSGGEIVDARITADSQSVIYRADQDKDDVFELYSVPVAGGPAIKLHGDLGSQQTVVDFDLAPLGDATVFLSDGETKDRFELFATPVNGGIPRKLNDPLPAAGDVGAFSIGEDGERVFYRGDQDSNGVEELFAVRLATDADADSTPTVCDCDDQNDAVWSLPNECADLTVARGGETTTLNWTGPTVPGGTEVLYDTLRTDRRDGFEAGSGATIVEVETDGADTFSSDTDDPDPAVCFFYVVRGGNLCGEGSIGCERDPVGPCL